MKLDNFSFSHPDIELKVVGTRIADLPINATALDCLAVQSLFSAEQIAESGLAPRILDAITATTATLVFITACLLIRMCFSDFKTEQDSPFQDNRKIVPRNISSVRQVT
jgi:hypothetical protein